MGVDVDIDLLESVVGDQLIEQDDLSYDPSRDRVIASRSLRYRDLTLRWQELSNPDPEACQQALAAALAANPDRILTQHPNAARWLERVAWVAQHGLADQLPTIDLAAAWDGLCAQATSLAEVAKRDPLPWLQMGWQHADLTRLDAFRRLRRGRSPAVAKRLSPTRMTSRWWPPASKSGLAAPHHRPSLMGRSPHAASAGTQ